MMVDTPGSLLPLVDHLAGKRVLVVGDVILDEYLIGRAERLSREAPIPVLEFERRDLIPGGAANPAANIVRLGSTAIQVGVVGADGNGDLVRHLLSARGIDPAGLTSDPARPTTTKTRIMATMGLRFAQQVARLDRLDRQPISGQVEAAICDTIRTYGWTVDAILASDYLTGLMTPAVVQAIRESRAPLLIADAQGELTKYQGFDLVKCNAAEASKFTGRALTTDQDFIRAGYEIGTVLSQGGQGAGTVVITRGPEGMTIVEPGTSVPTHIAAPQVEDVYDTVGAGDTVVAVFALARAAKLSLEAAGQLANLAAGIVIRKVGNYAPTPDELRDAIRAHP
jgi:rfaE bifunctional protein kinase chain/domain